MKDNLGIKAQSRVGVRNSEQGAVQGLRLTVQWDGGLDLGEVIMTLLNTPEFEGEKSWEFPGASVSPGRLRAVPPELRRGPYE